jgi:translocation protein SEC72
MTDSFLALPLKLDEKSKSVVCAHHGLPTCTKCGLDFSLLNTTHKNILHLPNDQSVPAPPNKPPPLARSQQIAKLKDSGNNSFKAHKYEDAVKFYSLAIDMATGRPPWEPAQLARDETVILLCNRSAAKFALGEYVESLADAEAVCELKKPWGKGHFRKSKALLAMGFLEESLAAIKTGLMYDKNDNECNLLCKEIERALGKVADKS